MDDNIYIYIYIYIYIPFYTLYFLWERPESIFSSSLPPIWVNSWTVEVPLSLLTLQKITHFQCKMKFKVTIGIRGSIPFAQYVSTTEVQFSSLFVFYQKIESLLCHFFSLISKIYNKIILKNISQSLSLWYIFLGAAQVSSKTIRTSWIYVSIKIILARVLNGAFYNMSYKMYVWWHWRHY